MDERSLQVVRSTLSEAIMCARREGLPEDGIALTLYYDDAAVSYTLRECMDELAAHLGINRPSA